MSINLSSCPLLQNLPAFPSEFERLASWHLVGCQICYLIAIFITFISSFKAVEMVWKKTIFLKSTKFILLLNLFYANMHQISYAIEASQLLYKHFFLLDRPCEVQQRDATCAPYFQLLIAECSGLFLCQTGLVIERACATFFKTYEKSKSAIITIIICLLVIIITSSTGKILIWDDPLTGYSFSCVSFPKPSLHRANGFYIVLTCLAFFNMVTTMMIMRYNKHLEYETRFKVGARFRKREAIESTETVCFVALSQFVLMFFYCGAVMILLYIRATVASYVFSSWVIWIYSVPFIAMMLPLVLIYRIRSNRANRVQIIKSFAETKHTQEDHIKQMKQTWGE